MNTFFLILTSHLLLVLHIGQTQPEARGQGSPGDAMVEVSLLGHRARWKRVRSESVQHTLSVDLLIVFFSR